MKENKPSISLSERTRYRLKNCGINVLTSVLGLEISRALITNAGRVVNQIASNNLESYAQELHNQAEILVKGGGAVLVISVISMGAFLYNSGKIVEEIIRRPPSDKE